MPNWPADYLDMRSYGLLDRLRDGADSLRIWDLRLLADDELTTLPEDRLFDITPFARTFTGDYWAYIAGDLPNSSVRLFFHDSDLSEYFAMDLVSTIFKQTVMFAGFEEILRPDDAVCFETAKKSVSEVSEAFADFFTEAMASALEQIARTSWPHTRGSFTTLLPPDEALALIQSCLGEECREGDLRWREC